jgi:hypothetical protein
MADQPFTDRRHRWTEDLQDRFKDLERRWQQTHGLASDHRPRAAGLPPPDGGLHFSSEDIAALCTSGHNAMIVGSAEETTGILDVIARWLAPPVVSCKASSVTLPDRPVGTLVIRNLERLRRDDQVRLSDWIVRMAGASRVITACSVPLFPLLARRAFDDVLFYRLNVISVVSHGVTRAGMRSVQDR